MTRTNTTVFTATPTGTGRTDYSQDVQKTVEPITQSWQETYKDYQAFTLNVGESATIETPIPSPYMILLYNFYLSCYPASDIELHVQYFHTSFQSWNDIVAKQANQTIDVLLEKGFPFLGKYRIISTNLGLAPIDCFYSAHGIITTQSQILQPSELGDAGVWQGLLP